MKKNLIVLAMLFSFVVSSLSHVSPFPVMSGSQPGFSSSILVLVDKSVPSQNYYNYYADGVGKWLTWWKMGFEEIDVSTTTINRASLDNYSVVLMAQFKLGDSGNLDSSELQAIYQAVTEDGVGLVQIDSYLLSYQNIWPNYISLFGVTVHNWVTTTSKLGLTISSTPHFITDIYRPGTQMNYLFPTEAGEFKESDLVFQNVTAGQGAISIATMSYNSVNYPAVIVNTQGYGNAVLSTFSTGRVSLMKTGYDGYGERMNAKTKSGMNGLLWRSIVWASKKPFAFMGMPPFMSYRVDDVAATLDDPIYMDKIIQYGFFGDFYLFQDDVANRGTSYQNRLKNYYLNGSAHFSPHSWTDSNSIYWNQGSDKEYSASTLAGYFSKIDSQYQSWGITPSAMYVSHNYQCGANALPFLRERGWLYTSQIYQIPYSNGAVTGNWIWESDWKRPGVLDYVDADRTIFSTAVDMPVGIASADYQDYLWNAESNVAQATKQMLCVLEHGLSDLFWGQVFTHEQPSSGYDAADWDKIFTWVVGNLTAQYPFTIKAGGEYIARYIQNRENLSISEQSFSGDTLTLDFSGNSTMPIALYLFTNSRIASYTGMLDYFRPYGDQGYMVWIPPYQNGHRTTITFGDVETSSPHVRFTTANITSTSSSPLQMTISSKPLWIHDKPLYFFEVFCSTAGRPESISGADGTPIQFSYNDGTKIASFNRTLPLAGSDTILAWRANNTYTLTFSMVGSGSVSLNNTGPYHLGDVVRLTAVPTAGWSFSGWSGALSGSVNPADLTVTGNLTVTATFIQNAYSVSVSVLPSSVAGTVTANATGPYHYGDLVVLTESASLGYTFSGWSGDGSGTGSTRSVTVTGNMSVTATFTQDQYSLTMYTIGQGSVVPGNQTFASGTVVDIKAINAVGWTFAGWSGGASGSANTTVTMNGPVSVTATFTQNTYTLTAAIVGGGVVNLNNTGPYHYGDVVELTAVSAAEWSFQSWSGDLLGSVNPSTIVVNRNMSVTATFTQNAYILTVSVVGSGSVAKVPDQASYHLNDVVTLTASPTAGWSFSAWSGDLAGSTNPAALVITGNMSVTATFIQDQYTLTITIVGSGSVGKSPDQATYTWGTNVTLTANPAAGRAFANWSGDASGTANSVTVNMTRSKAVTATFTLSGDIKPPTYSNIQVNTTVASNPCQFSSYWQDDVSLSGFIFSTNNTGIWVNDTYTSFVGLASWANVTKILNGTVAHVVSYRWYCNDTSNNWNNTGIQRLITTVAAQSAIFGKTTIGAKQNTLPVGYVVACRFQAPANGTATQISAYIRAKYGAGQSEAMIYSDTNGKPGSLLFTSGQIALSTNWAWHNFSVNYELQAGKYYWFTIFASVESQFRYDPSQTSQQAVAWGWNYPSVPTAFNGIYGPSYANRVASIYVTYAPDV